MIAVLLALLFRAFVAEAFMIPTGSMAPTLAGGHCEIQCDQCGYWYRAGASVENDDGDGPRGKVVATTCPLCRHTMLLDREHQANQRSFSDDRIMVTKCDYGLHEPQRWDVIVFKFPGNAKQNDIKRIVGLPGETLMIRHGDVHIRQNAGGKGKASSSPFCMARKPPRKLLGMLQVTDDTKYTPDRLIKSGWPLRWQAAAKGDASWKAHKNGHSLVVGRSSDQVSWLRYRHYVPSDDV